MNGLAVPKGWCQRAQRESIAMADFLRDDIRLHTSLAAAWLESARRAADASTAFSAQLTDLPDADPACGTDYLALLMRDVHGLTLTPHQAVDMAQAIDPAQGWQQIIAGLSDIHPANADAAFDSYRHSDVTAVASAQGLVTPAQDSAGVTLRTAQCGQRSRRHPSAHRHLEPDPSHAVLP